MGTLTAWTRANTSPVVGQTLSRTSPLPFHWPSYTPGISDERGMSRAARILEALLEMLRVQRA